MVTRLDAGREWVRRFWYEANSIRARDGAPPGVSHEWWSELTDALAEMLGDQTVPWTTAAARLLIAPYEERLSQVATERDRYRAERDAASDSFADAMIARREAVERADTASRQLAAARAALEWYGEKAEALARYMAGPDKSKWNLSAIEAVFAELSLDAGKRKARALLSGETP